MTVLVGDYLVLGGGLAGLNAAHVFAQAGKSVVLLDSSLPQAKGALGGFTCFSGAKFSLLPAGQGLIPVAGSVENLNRRIDEALDFCGITDRKPTSSTELLTDKRLAGETNIRSYQSIVLTPSEVEHTVQSISDEIRKLVRVVDASIVNLRYHSSKWIASTTNGPVAQGRVLISAGGRSAGSLLKTAGATPQDGKGIDLGVRIEFLNRDALKRLRDKGPDAKILRDKTRTFCLNHPGTIFRYNYEDISIPGGIVASETEPSANFGILTRVEGKNNAIARVLGQLRSIPRQAYEAARVVKGAPFQDRMPMIQSAYGKEVAESLRTFGEALGELGLVEWDREHRIHFPLLDWHWDVFAVGRTHQTDHPDLFVAGDTAGHARGLLQAAVSGRLAALEALEYAGI